MDFTIKKYEQLISVLKPGDYTVLKYLKQGNSFILRHDVERMIGNALEMAKLENKHGIKSTYYFRIPYSFNRKIIDKIHKKGHEIGYHYETLAKAKGDYQKAIDLFKKEHAMFNQWNVKTISMHGSPASGFDNKELWKEFDFKKLGLIGEAYLSIDFKKIPYATDTGRAWNKTQLSRRDKVKTEMPNIRNTDDLILKIKHKELTKLYITTHPHRWNDNKLKWLRELVWQSTKNIVKRWVV